MQTDRTVPNNKLDITIRGNEKGTRMLKDFGNFRRQKCDQERSREDYKIQRPCSRNKEQVERKNKSEK